MQGGMREARQGGGRAEGDFSAMNSGGYRPELGRMPDPNGVRGAQEAWQQGMRELSTIRQELAGDAEASKEVQQFIRDMQRLDPSRFPGNPALVDKVISEMRSGVEQLELQLRRKLEDQSGNHVRSATPATVPNGYRDSVAEYFRRLSKSR